MALRDTLQAVLREYDSAKLTTFPGNPLAAFIRKEAVLDLERAAGPAAVGLLFAGSAGEENWADVPWLAAFDPVVTDSATRGYYVVYLFHVSEPIVHLSLNQGTTAVRDEFGATARKVLSERAAFVRDRLPDFVLRLPATQIALGSTARLPGDHAAGHALGVTYSLENLPYEQALADDLRSALQAYRALTSVVAWTRSPRQKSAGSSSNRNRLLNCASIDCTVGLNAIPPLQGLRSDTTVAVARHVTSIWESGMAR